MKGCFERYASTSALIREAGRIDPEEVAIIVAGKPYKCAVAHNLGQVRRLLEGDYKNYDVVRLMA